jgi:hypothetical protein
VEIPEYCREVETYLCQKNDGHLIRVVGPSFDMVARWAADGVPLKVAFGGIDRYFRRYYGKGARRRPVRIDFCEADVLDMFDEWRRATGLTAAAADGVSLTRRGPSLPEHLARVLLRLTDLRATGVLGTPLDTMIDQLSSELDRVRASAGGLRGDRRKVLIERLAAADAALLAMARGALDVRVLAEIRSEADAQVTGAGLGMPNEVRQRARERAVDQLIRERLGLPIVVFL